MLNGLTAGVKPNERVFGRSRSRDVFLPDDGGGGGESLDEARGGVVVALLLWCTWKGEANQIEMEWLDYQNHKGISIPNENRKRKDTTYRLLRVPTFMFMLRRLAVRSSSAAVTSSSPATLSSVLTLLLVLRDMVVCVMGGD